MWGRPVLLCVQCGVCCVLLSAHNLSCTTQTKHHHQLQQHKQQPHIQHNTNNTNNTQAFDTPENPYLPFDRRLAGFSNVLNFHGLTALVDSLWPYVALAYLSALGLWRGEHLGGPPLRRGRRL